MKLPLPKFKHPKLFYEALEKEDDKKQRQILKETEKDLDKILSDAVKKGRLKATLVQGIDTTMRSLVNLGPSVMELDDNSATHYVLIRNSLLFMSNLAYQMEFLGAQFE